MNEIEAIAVRLVGADSPIPTTVQPVAKPGTRTSFQTVTVANIIADGSPRQLLPDTPKRTRASIVVSGNAGDTVVLAGSEGEARNGSGAVIPVGVMLILHSTDAVWVGQATGNSPTVAAFAEFEI